MHASLSFFRKSRKKETQSLVSKEKQMFMDRPLINYAMLCYAMLCYAMLCYAMLCYAMLFYAILFYVFILENSF